MIIATEVKNSKADCDCSTITLMENTQPGQVITPGATIEPVAPPPPQAVSPVSEPVPQASPADAPQPVAPAVDMTPPLPALPQQPYPQEPLPPTPSVVPAIPEATPFPAQNTPMESFTPSPEVVPQSQEVDLQWVASEPPRGHKDATWYGVFVLAAIVLSALVYLFTRDIVSTGVVIVAIVGLIFFASRQLADEECALDAEYLHVGQKAYNLQEFKAFSIDESPATPSVTLLPLKRLMPAITVHFPPEYGQAIVDHVGAYLPHEPHKTDAIDSFLRRIRF